MDNTSQDILINRLEQFIKKYYQNKILKGAILNVLLAGIVLTIISLAEFFGNFSSTVRTAFFFVSVGLFAFVIAFYLAIPAFKLLKIGKRISYYTASQILSSHFSELKDKLFNTLELMDALEHNPASRELVLASVNQRIEQLRPFSFTMAISFKTNYKYLKYLLYLSIVVLGIFLISPSVFKEGTTRVVQYNVEFEKKAPFTFEILNDSLNVLKGDDIEIKLRLGGAFVPENANIQFSGNEFFMNKENNTEYTYKFQNVNNSLNFSFAADGYTSRPYRINVLPKPLILNFDLFVDVPSYTGEEDFRLYNVGDITVPVGSVAKWHFYTKDADSLFFAMDQTFIHSPQTDSGYFEMQQKLMKNFQYAVSLKNKFVVQDEIVRYQVKVIPDLYPEIRVESFTDSLVRAVNHFYGFINDDYGFSKLQFFYTISRDGKEGALKSESIEINTNIAAQDFYYGMDFSGFNLEPGDNMKYYFQVWDNDRINGSKSVRSKLFEYRMPTAKEINDIRDKVTKNMESKVNSAMDLANKLQKDISKLQQSIVDKSMSDWEKNETLKDLAQKQKSLEDLLNEIQNQNKDKNNMMENFSEQQESIMEKQKQIEDLLENVLSDEMKELIDEISKLQQDMDEKKLNELSEQLKFEYEDLEEQLDKNLELLKKFDVEQRIDNTSQKLKELAEKHENLSEITDDKKSDKEVVKEKLEKQEEEFKDLVNEYEKAKDLNEELKNKFDLENFDKDISDIEQGMQESKDLMEQGKNRKSSKSQKSTSNKMQEMASKMQQMMQQNSISMDSQNLETLKQVLDNLITFSFDEEDLMLKMRNMRRSHPGFVGSLQKQNDLKNNFQIINDSLLSLAEKTPQISSLITKELNNINSSLEQTISLFEDNMLSYAFSKQQYIMTYANNLALLLSEIMDSMQNQMAGNMSGDSKGNNPKPKPGGTSMSDLKQKQQSLKSQLEEYLKQLQKGGKKGNQGQMNKGLAKMLAQQEVFEKMLRDLRQRSSLSQNTLKKLNEIEKLAEQNKKDIINRNISRNSLKRQNEIMTKLLEAETAEREKELEKKRESKEAKDIVNGNQTHIKTYKSKNKTFKENFSMQNLRLLNFYRNKYKQYLIKLNQE